MPSQLYWGGKNIYNRRRETTTAVWIEGESTIVMDEPSTGEILSWQEKWKVKLFES